MSIGVMILVMASSFSHGISDILFNRILRWVAGHVTICFNEKGKTVRAVTRDRDRMMAILADEKNLILESADALGAFGRAIGNGKTDNIIVIGVDTSEAVSEKTRKEVEESYRLIEGEWTDLRSSAVENPVIITEEKAKNLNVRKNDIIRFRFPNIYGQQQAARLTVIGIMKNENIFMQPVVFLELSNARKVMGYRNHETGNINITIKDPEKNASVLADRIHSRLKPDLAVICASVENKKNREKCIILGLKSDKESKLKRSSLVKVVTFKNADPFSSDSVFISEPFAKTVGAKIGDPLPVSYETKYGSQTIHAVLPITGIYEPTDGFPDYSLIVHDEKFYNLYYDHLPKPPSAYAGIILPDKKHPLYSLLAPEWILLDRTTNTDQLKKKYKDMGKNKYKSTLIDVRTMYESASDILKLEKVLNLITVSAVMILLFIILLGVVNTLRMTIRERTREIGTIRAIGMQKIDVRNIFVMETIFLSLFSSIIGIIAAFIGMWALSQMTIRLQDNPLGMLLINGHLHFVPSSLSVAGTIVLILMISMMTAWFPARAAANLSPAKALRHYE